MSGELSDETKALLKNPVIRRWYEEGMTKLKAKQRAREELTVRDLIKNPPQCDQEEL